MLGARAKVPLLSVDETFYICESLVVADYIAERFATDGGILPSDPEERAIARLFTEVCGSCCFSYFSLLRAKDDKLREEVKAFREGLEGVNAFLTRFGIDNGPFLFGDRFSLAECHAAPFVVRACAILPAFTGGDCHVDPLEICDELGLVRLRQWMEAVLSRPSVIATCVSKEEMIESTTRMLERFAAMDQKN
mmetsp:Transcript_2646/g.3478  ORF Transcript_2646/g.3478 Transcript_2646/m.3478 type:complete len:193 (+) Transcript_2646:324-902(+)